MEILIPWYAAICGLILVIVLILFKLNPTYSLIIGAVIGALIGGASLPVTLSIVTAGMQSVMGTVVRIVAAGIFAGVMMESGAADTIAKYIVSKIGGAMAMFSLALATMVITAVGVFIPVAVVIVAPIALQVAHDEGYSKISTLVALSGGGKAGNIVSPNPNTIAVADGFGLSGIQAMAGSIIPALVALLVTVLIANTIKAKGTKVEKEELEKAAVQRENNLSVVQAFSTPTIAILLMLAGPILNLIGVNNFSLDSFYALPIAGIIGALVMKQGKKLFSYAKSGLDRMTPTVLIIIGAGAIGGLISTSDLPAQVVSLMTSLNVPSTLLAPISGVLMGAATASTSTGVILVVNSFGDAILNSGISPLAAAVTAHTGAVVLDHLPHGTYFHVSQGALKISFADRMKVVLFESIIGLSAMVTAVILYGFIL